jgi:excinuclease ABC subunit C
MYAMLDMAKKMFPLRNCNLKLSQENIEAGKFKVCLEFHIGNCKGPCENLQTEEDYNEGIAKIRDLIKGNVSAVIKQLKQEIAHLAETMQFELAQEVKERLDALESYQARSTVVSSSITKVDVFAFRSDEKAAYVSSVL